MITVSKVNWRMVIAPIGSKLLDGEKYWSHHFKRPVFQSRSRSEFEEKLHFLSKYNHPGVACCRGQSKASAGIHLEEYDAEHKLQTYNDDCHKESSLYDGESPWEQECNCNNEHGRSGRVEGDADFENHYMFALNKKIILKN